MMAGIDRKHVPRSASVMRVHMNLLCRPLLSAMACL